MRETKFIQQNEEKWRAFEQEMERPYRDPEKLSRLFLQITDDLSYSRTFYPNRSVRVYLNGLAQRIFLKLYQRQRSPGKRFLHFWREDLPDLVLESRQSFRLSFAVFLLAFLIGAVSCAMDENFAVTILGQNYIDMTMANIESGDPMAVYKQKGALGMSLGITINNLWVAFLTFVLGGVFMIGSILILIRNGIMVGVFQYFFIERDLFWDSFLTIWIHGTLEISAIIIAGAAGITMGRGLVFPGTYSRAQSFQRSARRGIQLMVGIVPIIILAGFIEGFFTRYTEVSPVVRGGFILACLAFVLGYFVWYPRYRAKRYGRRAGKWNSVPPDTNQAIDFYAVKGSGEVFGEVFALLRQHLGFLLRLSGLAALVFTALAFLGGDIPAHQRFYFPYDLGSILRSKGSFFVNPAAPWLWLGNTLAGSIMAMGASYLVWKQANPADTASRKQWIMGIISALVLLALLQFSWRATSEAGPYLSVLLFPVVGLSIYASFEGGRPLPAAVARAFRVGQASIGTILGLFVILMLLGGFFSLLTDTAVVNIFTELAGWVVRLEGEAMQDFSTAVLTFTSAYMLQLIMALLFLGAALVYYPLREMREATALQNQIENIGTARRIKGLDRE